MGIHERTVSIVLLYMSFSSHNFPVKRLVFVRFQDKEKSFVEQCKSNISKHWRIGSYSSPQHAPTCGISHAGESTSSTNIVIDNIHLLDLKWFPSHRISSKLCCYDARGCYKSSGTHIFSCQVKNWTAGDDISLGIHLRFKSFCLKIVPIPPFLIQALLLCYYDASGCHRSSKTDISYCQVQK